MYELGKRVNHFEEEAIRTENTVKDSNSGSESIGRFRGRVKHLEVLTDG